MKKGCLISFILVLLVAFALIIFGSDIVNLAMQIVYPQRYTEIVQQESSENGLESDLVYAVIKAESKFDADAVSHAGAVGLMQLTPETFNWVYERSGIDPSSLDIYSPKDNIRAGCLLLKLLIEHYGNIETALAAYNAGMGNCSSWLEDSNYSSDGVTLHTIPFPETRKYVENVMNNYSKYKSIYS